MTHGFSSTDKSKKPMNCYYDFSDSKFYAYDSNEELQEITLGGGGNVIVTRYSVTSDSIAVNSRESKTINLKNTVDLTKTSFRLINTFPKVTGIDGISDSCIASIIDTNSTSFKVNFYNLSGSAQTFNVVVEVIEYS